MIKTYIYLSIAIFFPLIVAAQTVAYYHCDGTNGTPASTIADSGPSGWDGMMVGTANYTNGVINSGLDLSGDLNYVTIPQSSSLELTNSWTVEMFFRANVPYTVYGSDPSGLITKLNTSDVGIYLDSFHLQLSSSGNISAQIGFGNLTGQPIDSGSQQNYSDGQWHHVALVYDMSAGAGTNTLSLYADYALVSSVSGAFPPIVWANYPIDIGAGNYPAGEDTSEFRRNFDGQVDEIRISNGALTPDQFISETIGHVAPLSIQGTPGGVLLKWGTATNETYQLQSRQDLNSGAWLNFGGSQLGTGSEASMPDSFVQGRAASFYRLLATP